MFIVYIFHFLLVICKCLIINVVLKIHKSPLNINSIDMLFYFLTTWTTRRKKLITEIYLTKYDI